MARGGQYPPELSFARQYTGLGTQHLLKPRTTIPHRVPLTLLVGISCPTSTGLSTRALWLFGLPLLLIIVFQLFACGPVCDVLPVGGASYIDLREVLTEFRLFNQPQWTNRNAAKAVNPVPMLIPRIIHQTYRTRQLPTALRAIRQTWTRVNEPAWQVRFYDDEACIAFVRREFPEYLDAYLSLPKDVERSDFFRYMVILRLGGVYADIDVELRQPLDTVLGPTDTLVVGWEAEVATDVEAFKRHFVRKRQVLQWFFAAAPGHPVLKAACDHITWFARHTFSNNTNRDTLERTGPGMWTDVVLRHAAAHPPHKADDPWKVRILPRVAFGVHPAGIDGLTPDAKEIVVLHHFLGSWKKRGGWHKRPTVLQILVGVIRAALQRRRQAVVAEEPITPSVLRLFPVSAAFNPPFTIMTHLIGQGDMQSGSDVSAHLTSWGTWQAAMSRPSRRPLVVDALVGALGPPEQGALLVDVSAGTGFFTLAAAARGHKVVAFETSSRSIEALSTSIIYNGFEDRIRLYNVSLGAVPSTLCLRQRSGVNGLQLDGGAGGNPGARLEAISEPNDAIASATRRGYGDPGLHSLSQPECVAMTVRQTLAHMLMGGSETPIAAAPSAEGGAAANGAGGLKEGAVAAAAATAAAADSRVHRNVSGWSSDDDALAFQVGALRLSAHGWEGWILDGAEPWLRQHRPGVVLLEYAPALIERSSYPGGGLRLLHTLYDLGYVYVAHTGYVCDERWFNISRALKAGGRPLSHVTSEAHGVMAEGMSKHPNHDGGAEAGGTSGSVGEPPLTAAASAQLPRQPTWCKLKPDLFQLLTDRVHPEVAENVLFIHQTHTIVRGEQLPPDQGARAQDPTSSAGPSSATTTSEVLRPPDGAYLGLISREGVAPGRTAAAVSRGSPAHGQTDTKAAALSGTSGEKAGVMAHLRGKTAGKESADDTKVQLGRRLGAGGAQRVRRG